MDVIKVCDYYDSRTHKPIEQFVQREDGAGGVELAQVIIAKAPEELLTDLRVERDRLLAESDRLSGALWVDRWMALTDGQRAAWAAYRQALRDLPDAYGSGPLSVVWPPIPAL